MFLNRESELEALEQRYQSGNAEFFVIYGRRRVGKTELLLQFCKNKKSIYFIASQLNEQDHLRQLKELAGNVIDDPLLQSMRFTDWETTLIYFSQKSQEERLIIVLDEFQYLCEDNTALPSLIQRFWDLTGKNSNLFLILCGSQVGFMEREVLSEKSPLFGRRTGQLQLMPLSYRNSTLFFPGYNTKEKIMVYCILGGIPAYLKRFEINYSRNSHQNIDNPIKHNIINEMLTPQGYLFDEVNFLLRMELREIRIYSSILQAIAGGATRINEITQRVNLDQAKTNKYLSVLRDLRLVNRVIPITERAPEKSRKGIYKISDNYLNFWFRFILPNRSLIETGNSQLVYQQLIEPFLSDYMGLLFEELCRQYVSLYWEEKLKIAPLRIGSHWDANCEIDLLTHNMDGSHWFGECKWWNKPVGVNVLNQLIDKSTKVPDEWGEKPRYVLFSLSGFNESLRQRANDEDVILIELDDLLD
ncbi:ATPase [Candidatus Poribacteria bacterium]|nr:MAG: ATPase [Candidatus Poribacteria bacterium]